MAIELVLFDFDGVLVDSYSCLPSVYRKIAAALKIEEVSFIGRAISWEDFHDALGMYDQMLWWPSFFREWERHLNSWQLADLLRLFWQERIKGSRTRREAFEVLEELKKSGYNMAVLAGSDSFPGLKRRRIKEAGFESFFASFYLLGETVSSREEALQRATQEFNCEPSQIAVVDDKPAALQEVKAYSEKILTIKVLFSGPLKKSWSQSWKADYEVVSLEEIISILKKH